ncbi:MAG: hypothetical protein WB689_03565 [Xanthobacteraceae bacterium]
MDIDRIKFVVSHPNKISDRECLKHLATAFGDEDTLEETYNLIIDGGEFGRSRYFVYAPRAVAATPQYV